MNFEKINLTDMTVIVGLVIMAFMAIFYGNEQLAMSIASGLIGYLGGTMRPTSNNKNKIDGGNGK